MTQKEVRRIMRSKKIVSGVAFCVHHNKLVEYCYDAKERLTVIRDHKPKGEYKTRIKNFVLIPDKFLPELIQKAYAQWKKAHAERWKAHAEWWEAHAKRWKAHAKLQKAHAEWPEKDKLALLNKLNPRHTWNGENIEWE